MKVTGWKGDGQPIARDLGYVPYQILLAILTSRQTNVITSMGRLLVPFVLHCPYIDPYVLIFVVKALASLK